VINQCKEVIGRHNHTLQTLDLHDTRMTSPAAASVSNHFYWISKLLSVNQLSKTWRFSRANVSAFGCIFYNYVIFTNHYNSLILSQWQKRVYRKH